MSKALHNQILGLPCPATQSQFSTRHELNCFMDGHQAARHSAAALAIISDDCHERELKAARALLREVLNEVMSDAEYSTITKTLHDKVDGYLSACDPLEGK